ncbi:hypothetical protein [Wenyingzhuangia sp. 2_MG-2023]|uniref:hypothetical protein n=1 Tax=Wenyingzhuangia sp. 2_MG-2023 TaxID=3062639 RepID=UPI0026E2EC88|nr:hypothetical protein [Wenyingzhuangia sp. 2_MG-2023]MDO6738785.1 hypothetical protein [Wenyingzhuangia sp. 2_MG-2023]MDO6801966.1 hypothetical protein [Wenyingzhuangia sp. 1_MG-2023]
MKKRLAISAILLAMTATVISCKEKSPKEKVEDGMEEVGEGIEDAAEETGDKIKEGAEEVEDEIDDATDAK